MNWNLLHKYLSNECTSEEEEKIKRWMDADKENREFFDSLAKIWSVEPADGIEVDSIMAWESFKEKLPDEKKGKQTSQTIRSLNKIQSESYQRKGYRRSIAISVAAAAIVVIAALLYLFMPDLGLDDRNIAQKSKVQQISTELGQRTSLRLADGTHVYLNADSHIKIPPAFGDSARSVELEGEAYFDVTHDTDHPFMVHSGHSYTRVLGTKFGVKAYPQDEAIQVIVEEGEVAVGSSGVTGSEDMHLTKNQMGILSLNGQTLMKEVEGLANYLGWKDGRLVFESTPFEEVVPRLERWYNIEIEADPALSSQQVTASFDNEPMLEVLNILALSLDAEFERDSRKINFNLK